MIQRFEAKAKPYKRRTYSSEIRLPGIYTVKTRDQPIKLENGLNATLCARNGPEVKAAKKIRTPWHLKTKEHPVVSIKFESDMFYLVYHSAIDVNVIVKALENNPLPNSRIFMLFVIYNRTYHWSHSKTAMILLNSIEHQQKAGINALLDI
jgi:hypothetical protein